MNTENHHRQIRLIASVKAYPKNQVFMPIDMVDRLLQLHPKRSAQHRTLIRRQHRLSHRGDIQAKLEE